MARRCMKMFMVVAAALMLAQASADADCLRDGEACVGPDCPPICCSGTQIRIESNGRHCPALPPSFTVTEPAPDNGSNASGLAPASSASSAPGDSSAPAPADDTNTNTGAPPASASQNADTSAPTPAPTPTPSGQSAESLQSTTSLAGSRQGLNGATTLFVVVGALAGCIVLVAAVMYKKKTTTQSLEIPGSSYHGSSNDAGLTPDNRSLVGMLDGGCRATTESMKQLPVLSLASRQDVSSARISSPFGQGGARISSPANRGGYHEDYAFAVDNASRAGSNVEVAFTNTTIPGHDLELVVEKNGVVAL